jgi:hypothetical protein
METIIGIIVIGAVLLIMGACAFTPVILDSMSKEELDAAGIVWHNNDIK